MPLLNAEKALRSLRKTPVILYGLLSDVDQERAQTATDGPDGWSVLYVVCHLRDFEDVFSGRARQMVETDLPQFQVVDHEALVQQNRYGEQDLRQAFDGFLEKRRAFVRLLEGLTGEQWARRGVHPQTGESTVLEIALNTALHDLNHLEQIARALGLSEALL
jgi:hypothetical protein